ncbi:3,4-dihydroxy-2-butanone 4-phosphate synthase [Nadsonia fulvescens var. elongata DSM 6958]|uniref:3,4-dihydroxy-2-butanone 4-phosphate synthase n=1 Tax=Nadsonia fulvescens var. elongata DSM 6958 TaxID=857566 RepID=A0A1E3PGK4_9ASCO|nr:3,4-dihydroxy-2-butanone 4-phosphate synthase [Nadsonia fulvescens var. elongata DSM 6958]
MSLFDSIPDAIEAFKNGEFLVVLDDESRENEGDLIIAASHITTSKMAFLVRHSSGYVCAPLTNELADKLELPYMIENRSDRHGTAYTVTVDAIEGTTTGISASDRAITTNLLSNPNATAADFMRPGHILPLRARDGGILQRRGHTEAAVDLCKLAGQPPVGVICEIVRDEDGLMARRDDCLAFAKTHGLKAISIDDLAKYLESQK